MVPETKKKACYNCVKRRIICDTTAPRCNKCAKKKLECPGYGVRYRFVEKKSTHPKSTSAIASPTSTSTSTSKRQYVALKGISQKRSPLQSQLQDSESLRLNKSSLAASSTSRNSSNNESITGASDHPQADFSTGDADFFQDFHSLDIFERSNSIPPLLLDLDVNTIFHFENFETRVSPYMLMFDDEANGYRHYILPLAHTEPIVQRAVCVVSMFHLSQTQPGIRVGNGYPWPGIKDSAEVARAAIISELSSLALVQSDLSEITWATILLLLVGDLVCGHEEVMSLYQLLLVFIQAHRPADRPLSALGSFLDYQSSMIHFFAKPGVDELGAIADFKEVQPSPVLFIEQYAQRQRGTREIGPLALDPKGYLQHFPLYEAIYRIAGEVYLLRAQSHVLFVDRSGMEEKIAQIRALCERVDFSEPGAHALVWPSFVAAAETRYDEHRRFFCGILRSCWKITGYASILKGIKVLDDVWAQEQRRWTALLPECKGFIMF
ncbi:hypothetical protein MGN70_006179 [Eutypa lata]|nr:hypothetical protein MGN70_006179 [Eutypa lata]